MAEVDEAARAAGRLEQALDRIEVAAKARLRDPQPDLQNVQRVAQRLDTLIAELRAALAHASDDDGQ
jgi:hypothetical protein